MKKLYTLSFLILCLSVAKADYWTQKADLPGHKRVLPISFSMGNYGYIGWGTDTTNMSVKDLWAYNANSNTWTQKATFPGAARSGAACFANYVSGKVYAGLGQNTLGTLYSDWWEYNTATNTWAAKAAFPGGQRTLAVGFFTGLYGYVGMGSGIAGDFNDLYLYEPVSNTWQAKPSLPSSFGRREVAAFVVGVKAYIATGYSTAAGSSLIDLYEWDSSTDTWTQKNSLYGDARYGASSFSLYGRGYVGLGKTVLTVYTTDLWGYDVNADNWFSRANFYGTGRFEAASFAINDSGYVGCGGSPSSFYRDFWKYTPDTVTVGVNEFQVSDFGFRVYPNPASLYTVIRMQTAENETIALTITNIQGSKVYSEQFETRNTKHETKINVSHFKSGIYFIVADNGKQKVTKKFLKE